MKFKVGNTWFRCTTGQPLMVQFTDKDLENISNMIPSARHYATFDDEDAFSHDEMREWMSEESVNCDENDLKIISNNATQGPWVVRSFPKPAYILDDDDNGEWDDRHAFITAPRNKQSDPYDIEVFGEDRNEKLYPPHQARADMELTIALVNLYRAGRLVVLPQ